MRLSSQRLTMLFLALLLSFVPCRAGEGRSAVSSGDRLVRTIAITFDDGPHQGLTTELLDMLDSLNVRASFFLVGKMVDRNPEITREIYARGHTVANHSYEHRNSSALSQQEFLDDLRRCCESIERNIPVRVRFFRPPGGNFTKEVLSLVEKAGLRTVLWDINSRDYTGVSTKKLAERIISKSAPGSILLFHSGVTSTIEALPVIVDALRKKGFEFVTLDEMLSEYTANEPPSLERGSHAL